MKNTSMIDDLVYRAVFSDQDTVKKESRQEIRQLAKKQGIFPASINSLYLAFGQGKVAGFTVPAFNIRALTYDTARIIFRLAQEKKLGAFIFEIARSEQDYTEQKPDEYATVVLAAAIKEGYQGPVFIQGDHYQFKPKIYFSNPQEEIQRIETAIKESIAAGFYNIDIDASTLVDLEKENLDEQQKENYLMTAKMTKYVRQLEPKGITVSVGGEIGHIGGKNSTVEEFETFMEGYLKEVQSSKFPTSFTITSGLRGVNKVQNGLSKVSVQTGTSHGGVVTADGKLAKVDIDFQVLKKIGEVARKKYRMGGAVQHGASTLPNELFDQFPKTNTLEIHLATGFQNIVYENLPLTLKEEIYRWMKENLKKDWKEGWTEEQFIYKMRKKALGPFKKKLWEMSEKEKTPILSKLKNQFTVLFEKLKVVDTKKYTDNYGSEMHG